jgi:hypothetical protein
MVGVTLEMAQPARSATLIKAAKSRGGSCGTQAQRKQHHKSNPTVFLK